MTRPTIVGRWRIDLDARPGVPRIVPGGVLARLAGAALDAAVPPAFPPSSLGVILTDDAELARLNGDHMGKRGPTDVLSFPLLAPSSFAPDAPPPVVPRPPRARLHLGDVVVSVERAVAQAASGRGGQTGDVRWSAASELRLLLVHGVLHVCGYDHGEPDDERAMRALELAILIRR